MQPINLMVERMKRAAEKSVVLEEQLYKCHICLDEGFTHYERRNNAGAYQGDVAHFCEECQTGIRIEAGYWVALLRPANKRFRPSPKDGERFKERQRQHPNGLRLRNLVDGLGQEKMEDGSGD
jgi:hypothetical protein